MSVGAKIYGVYARRNQSAMSAKKGVRKKHAAGKTSGVCPFTLESFRNCATKRSASGHVCHFSLEECLGSR